MIILALGTVISLSGISSCKKPAPMDSAMKQRLFGPVDLPLDQGQNFYGGSPGHAPIPGTLLLVGSGVAGMAWFGWRRRTKH
ncbi:MAG: hypothetical protein ACYC6G_01905 [Desulfobaccales bacterium]